MRSPAVMASRKVIPVDSLFQLRQRLERQQECLLRYIPRGVPGSQHLLRDRGPGGGHDHPRHRGPGREALFAPLRRQLS